MSVQFGAISRISAESVKNPRQGNPGTDNKLIRQDADHYAQSVLETFQKKRDSEFGFLAMQLTDDRIELSLRREENFQDRNDPRMDRYVATVSAPGQETNQITFNAAHWVPDYGNSERVKFNEYGVSKAAEQAFRAIVIAHKKLTASAKS